MRYRRLFDASRPNIAIFNTFTRYVERPLDSFTFRKCETLLKLQVCLILVLFRTYSYRRCYRNFQCRAGPCTVGSFCIISCYHDTRYFTTVAIFGNDTMNRTVSVHVHVLSMGLVGDPLNHCPPCFLQDDPASVPHARCRPHSGPVEFTSVVKKKKVAGLFVPCIPNSYQFALHYSYTFVCIRCPATSTC